MQDDIADRISDISKLNVGLTSAYTILFLGFFYDLKNFLSKKRNQLKWAIFQIDIF